MRRLPLAALLSVGLLAGCGSRTKTVTVTGPPATSSVTSASTSTGASTTASTPAPSPASTTSSTTTTRTAPEPAFTEQETHAEGVAQAAAVVRSQGYTPDNTAEYHPGQTLRVLVGTRTDSADGYDQRVFFFLDGRYLGTDAKEPSANVKVVAQSDTEIAVAYGMYRKSDPLCCPGGGQRVVHFALNDGQLTALDPIPPASSSTGLSRN